MQDSQDPDGLRVFYYLVQDLKVSAGLQMLLARQPEREFVNERDESFHPRHVVLHLFVDFAALQDQAQ